MLTIKQSKKNLIRNTLIRHAADNLSALWFQQQASDWAGDLESGHCTWTGDDGDEFIVIWNEDAFLAVASILESTRAPENDDGWDEEASPSGKKRGLQYLNQPPESVQKLYKKALQISSNEFFTGGFWGTGEQIEFTAQSDEDLEGGIEFFAEFGQPPEKFLWAKPDEFVDPLAKHFGLVGPMAPAADLAYKIGTKAFTEEYKVSEAETKVFQEEIKSEYGTIKVASNWKEYLNDLFGDFGITF